MTTPANDLSTNILAFCHVLRREHGFSIGHSEAADALRALDIVGITDRVRARTALRLVCCATQAQTLVFDRAFDAFFSAARPGVPQPPLAARHTRPGPPPPAAAPHRRPAPPQTPRDESDAGGTNAAGQRHAVDGAASDMNAWHALRARYSPSAARGEPLRIDPVRAGEMRSAAQRIVRAVSLGFSRRWKSMERGRRFDLRRTIRASLETGGDPVALRFLGHPRRNPHFVVLIDGSRSMAEHTGGIVDLSAALCERTVNASVFFFSTKLLDVTRELRTACRAGGSLDDLGEAWGGGTKIGDNLATFVRDHGSRLLDPQTVVIVFSDGLDVGDVVQLEGALREIDRRCAGIVWLNPHAALPGFAPTARGMRAALPFTTLLSAANDATGFEQLAQRIAQTPRIRGRRG